MVSLPLRGIGDLDVSNPELTGVICVQFYQLNQVDQVI